MPKILLFDVPEIDEVLMVVPDNYDLEKAMQQVEDVLSGARLIQEATIDVKHHKFSYYRPYVG